MNKHEDIIRKIQERLSTLSKSERKVAEAILAAPKQTIHSSIAKLAARAEVSEPTVNRFCRTLVGSGFPDFKVLLAQSLATGTPYINLNVEPDDAPGAVTNKVFEAAKNNLTRAQEVLPEATISRVVDILAQARRIEFYGLGASGSVALDAHHKFFRLNMPVVAYTDILVQRMAAAGAHSGDVIVIISYTGRTLPLIETARIARETGAAVIGITNPDSPLTEHCSIVLPIEETEDTDIYTPMSSRIVYLTLIDALATGVLLKRGPEFNAHLKKLKQSIQDTRTPKPEKK
ncbi:transcriptional regulator HexR [Marinomonas sp. C2222]|uniref:Transcriptional regulator HexR n=1 Tax=Marinomonas sargassi TaxID=2984494 RepID=A0ABT2YVK1_9GAMM|nr:transcriptional regulator HexR [Marinomonas sargassi]MCV2403937.1 transcriptional regulator HexR [Marinomonas sargassi]